MQEWKLQIWSKRVRQLTEFEANEQEVKIAVFESEETAESNSSHNTVNEKEKVLQFIWCFFLEDMFLTFSDWNHQKGKCFFQNKDKFFHHCGKARCKSKGRCSPVFNRVVLQDDAKWQGKSASIGASIINLSARIYILLVFVAYWCSIQICEWVSEVVETEPKSV